MKVFLETLSDHEAYRVQVTGTEDWLGETYNLLKAQGVVPSSRGGIGGYIDLVLLKDAGALEVKGEVQWVPDAECGRCADPIPFPLKDKIDRVYFTSIGQGASRRSNESSEGDLTEGDLDEFHLATPFIDLGELVCEVSQLMLPSRRVPGIKIMGNTEVCEVCQCDVSSACVYKDAATEDASQGVFSALSHWKSPKTK
jgi:hypothetical protein